MSSWTEGALALIIVVGLGLGLFLFTVRNGDNADLAAGRGMLYAEKIMISRQDQI